MARNVEIKLKVDSLESISTRLENLAAEGPWVLQQRDSFFHCPNGRLKLRQQEGQAAELIFYRRADSEEARLSDYHLLRLDDVGAAQNLLHRAMGHLGDVVKTRWLYLIGPTRVHLDRVLGLGEFVELEVVLEPQQSVQEGERAATQVMQQLGLSDAQPVSVAYFDLLQMLE